MNTKLATITLLFAASPVFGQIEPPSPWTNLVVNGSFESPALPTGANYYIPRGDFTPWQTDGPSFEIWASNLATESAADGKQHLEILSTDGGSTSVWQTVATPVGVDYQFSFYHSPRPGVRSHFVARINGQVVATIDEDGSTLNEFKWRKFRTNFTAVATATTVMFSDAASTAAGTHIDNVVLERLPLSSTIRVSEVEIAWETVADKFYQVQYRSELTSNLWTDLVPPIQGNGTTNRLKDPVPVDAPKRFYRVISP